MGLAQDFVGAGAVKLTLLTNSPTPKVVGLEAYGLEITGMTKISDTMASNERIMFWTAQF